jgi:hypothetical protein
MYDYILVPFSENSEGIVQYYSMDSKPIGIFEDKFRFILSLTTYIYQKRNQNFLFLFPIKKAYFLI